jgi:hypothetical protein
MDDFSSTPGAGSAAFALRGDRAKTPGSARGGAGGMHRWLTITRIGHHGPRRGRAVGSLGGT